MRMRRSYLFWLMTHTKSPSSLLYTQNPQFFTALSWFCTTFFWRISWEVWVCVFVWVTSPQHSTQWRRGLTESFHILLLLHIYYYFNEFRLRQDPVDDVGVNFWLFLSTDGAVASRYLFEYLSVVWWEGNRLLNGSANQQHMHRTCVGTHRAAAVTLLRTARCTAHTNTIS